CTQNPNLPKVRICFVFLRITEASLPLPLLHIFSHPINSPAYIFICFLDSFFLQITQTKKSKQTMTVEATVSANPLLGSEEHNERDEIVKEINEPNSRWKAVFSDRFANTTVSSFFIHHHICVLIDSELLSFYDEDTNAYNFPLPSILQDVTLLSIPELPRLLDEGALKYLNDIKLNSNPYLKKTVVNKTNHMIEDESILEKAIGHGMAFPKSSFTKGKWSTTMISGEAVAANDLEMDEVQ
ncbi:unnamed protein product, partial [Brassica oleracea var. botrytis]